MPAAAKVFAKKILPRRVLRGLSFIRWRLPRILRNRQDLFASLAFVGSPAPHATIVQRANIVRQLYAISFRIASPHTEAEIISFVRAITALPRTSRGVVVEAGCFKGISTAKFSLAAAAAGRELVVFDSFQGIPENDEPHDRNIFGKPAHFTAGDYAGTLELVKANVAEHGNIGCCRFIEGWFEDTMPSFAEPIAAIYLDVDLASSTRTCIKHLYPLLEPGGVMYSQDGHLPLVIEVLDDDEFWRDEVGCPKPRIDGLGRKKLVRIVKARAPGAG